ncbi:MAG: zinc ribbon domain-containing protein [Blastocatellia bacterium]|nr:zinc ribbon domain-containing protein [Blastocatellia bacterium]
MNCRKCGAETLDSSLFCRLCGYKFKSDRDMVRLVAKIILVLIAMFFLLLAIGSLGHAQTKPRQIWVRMKGGALLTGDLVKMDPDAIEFKVVGILQSVNLDEVLAITFVPPMTPAEAKARAEAAAKDARERQARLDEAIKRESAPSRPPAAAAPPTREVEAPPLLPDKCEHHNTTIEKGHYHHSGFANTLHDFHYKGTFKSNGGKVNLYITDTENFAKFMNHKKFQAFYSLEKVTDGTFDVGFQKGVDYHLVILNPSVYDGVSVETDFCFSYPEQ